jgi:hypothetical protein
VIEIVRRAVDAASDGLRLSVAGFVTPTVADLSFAGKMADGEGK